MKCAPSHRRAQQAACVLVASLGFTGCAEVDTTAPPAPTVDPVETPTTIAVQTITGSAEYGSTVQITGGKEAVLTEADPFTARFAGEVALLDDIPASASSITTTLSVTATDLAGNESSATEVEIVYGLPPGTAASVVLTLTGDAADGIIEAGQDVTYDYEPLDLNDVRTNDQVLVIVDSADASVFDDGFSGSGIIVGLSEAKDYTITARVTGSSTNDSAPLTVTEATGTRLVELALSLSRMGIGDTVSAVVQVTDLFGNPIPTDATNLTLEIEPTNPAIIDFYTQNGNDFTITESGVFKITAVFDDGVNDVGEDFGYVIVETIPDLVPPSVWVDTLNGFPVCPSGIITDQADLSDCASRTTPAATFRRGSPITAELRASDNQSLVEVSFEAFASEISVSGLELIGAGTYTAGEELLVPFTFTIQPEWAGDVTIIGQAIDGKNNVDNSAPAFITVALDIVAGDRQVEVLASGPFLAGANDVAVSPAGGIFVVNADADLPQVIRVDQGAQTYVDFYPVVPEYLAFDASGNLYTSMREDVSTGATPALLYEIWKTPPGGTPAAYVPAPDASFNPAGLSTTNAIPGRGRWLYTNTVDPDYCLWIQIGPDADPVASPNDAFAIQLSSDCAASNPCAGTGVLGAAGRAADLCVETIADADQQALDLVAALNDPAVRAVTNVSAFSDLSCRNTSGTAARCVYLISDRPGTAVGIPTDQWYLPIVLGSDDTHWLPEAIAGGYDDGMLFVASDFSTTERVYPVQTVPAPTSDVFPFWDLNNVISNDFLHLETVQRLPSSAVDRTLTPFMFFYALDTGLSNTSDLWAWDSGRNVTWFVAGGVNTFARFPGGPTDADRLHLPRGFAYVPWDASGGDCIVVGNESYTAVPRPGELLAYTDIDTYTGATLENDLPMVTGFAAVAGVALDDSDPDPAAWSLIVIDPVDQAVIRIGRTPATDDCF